MIRSTAGPRAAFLRFVLPAVGFFTLSSLVCAGEPEIHSSIAQLLQQPERLELVREIEADPEYDRRRLGAWLHAAVRFESLEPGLLGLRIAVGFEQEREVILRIPQAYEPERPWPLILAYHPSGGSGTSFLHYVERVLGDEIERFVVAAPSRYRQTGVDAPPPFTNEHAIVMDTVRRKVHVDSDRVYVLGYSLGGYTAWTLAMLNADRLAGVIALASTYSVPVGEDGLWEAFLPNLRRVPVLNVWGANDRLPVPGVDGESNGTIASLNREFRRRTKRMDLPITHRPVAGRGHGDLFPQREWVIEMLGRRRIRPPLEVTHRFRHLHHARSYWLEARAWNGESWDEALPHADRREGESAGAALGRELRRRLGELSGTIDGQTIRLRRVGSRQVAADRELGTRLGRDRHHEGRQYDVVGQQ